jgi:hypothetical protein
MRSLLLSSVAIATSAALLALVACAKRADPRDAAVAACIAAVGASATEPDSARAGRAVATGCAELYAEPACRQGYTTAWDERTSPAERTRILVEACTAAYCPKLDEPRPDLCTAPAQAFAERAAQWQRFQRVVLVRDLGVERATRVLDAMGAAARARTDGVH